MGSVIGIISLKGGVGKTTISAALGADLANRYGKKVLLIDANYSAPNLGIHLDILSPHGTIHDVLNGSKLSSAIHSKHGVDIVPGNFFYLKGFNPLKLRAKLAHVRKQYDFVILDAPPNLNDELFSTLYAADEFFVVTTPDYSSLSGVMKLSKLSKQRGLRFAGIIVNRLSDPSIQLSLNEIQESTGIPVVSIVREDANVMRSLFARVPVSVYAKNSGFSKDIRKLSAALIGLPEKKSLFDRLFKRAYGREHQNREALRKHFYTSIFKDYGS